MTAALKNVSGWRLNAAEKKELEDRVSQGECEATVKKELQTRKAQANLDRKNAAAAVAQRCQVQVQQLAAKAKARGKAAAKAAAAGAPALALPVDNADIINKEYYSQVQTDMQRILAEYGAGFCEEMPLQISCDKDASGNATGGVQEPYSQAKAKIALDTQGVYRCSVSAWWFNSLSSPTPGVPMSRRRVEELADFAYGPEGHARFHSDRMIEVAVSDDDVRTDRPSNLQVISPEEILHATLAGSKNNFPEDEWTTKKAQWKSVLLSMPCCFCLVSKQDQWKQAFNRRQAVVQHHASLSRTGMQCAMEMAHFKGLIEANSGGVKFTPQTLAAELVKQGLRSVSIGAVQEEDDPHEGSLTPTFIAQALTIHKSVMSQPSVVEILMSLERRFGTRSCFHQLTKLHVLATKPSSQKGRLWALECIEDWLLHNVMKVTDISKSLLQGDKTHCGLLQLFELKQKASCLSLVLEYMHTELFPKAGLLDGDRMLLKEATSSHAAYRAHSGEGEVAWQARMKPSGILCFELVEDLVYARKYDPGVKQAAKLGGTPEHVFEQDPVKDAWQKIETALAKELEERKAAMPKAEDEGSGGEEEPLAAVRKSPAAFALHSPSYWRAVGNQCVRRYVTLIPEPKTTDGVVTAVSQCNLKDIAGNQGVDAVLTFLDMSNLGESQGPNGQPLLRKKYTPETALLRKLIQGSMLARGSQKRENGEATRVVDGDVICIHDGFSQPGGMKEAKSMFRLSTSKKDSELDSELKEVLVVFEEDSIRNRKQRIRGGYNCNTSMAVVTSAPFTQCLPEKAFDHHPGYCTSNLINRVKAMAPTEKVEILTEDRSVEVTPEAASKASDNQGLQSVFSASVLPVEFFRDLVKGHSAKAMLDLAAGQGNAAKGCLMERLPYVGFVLSEAHARKLEVLLTDFIVQQMKVEGSAHYRPEACAQPGAEEQGTNEEPKPKGKKNKNSGSDAEPKPKKTRKGAAKNADEGEGEMKEGEDEGEGEGTSSPLPW
eukprot:s4446_g6.t1